MSRRKILAGNWKMNHGLQETKAFFSVLEGKLPTPKAGCEFQLYLPYLSLATGLSEAPQSIKIGAQNAHWEMKGAFTGEISGPMLKEAGIDHVLVGHSERRQYFGETDDTVAKRALSLLKQGFQVLACIGETRAERESGQTNKVLEKQLTPLCTTELQAYFGKALNFAYEPVWAIGTGLTATPEQAQEAHAYVRSRVSASTSILYGGSVTPANFASLLSCKDIDGGLVGGASLKSEDWLKLAQILVNS